MGWISLACVSPCVGWRPEKFVFSQVVVVVVVVDVVSCVFVPSRWFYLLTNGLFLIGLRKTLVTFVRQIGKPSTQKQA